MINSMNENDEEVEIGRIHYIINRIPPSIEEIEDRIDKMKRDYKSQEKVDWYKHKNKNKIQL